MMFPGDDEQLDEGSDSVGLRVRLVSANDATRKTIERLRGWGTGPASGRRGNGGNRETLVKVFLGPA
jgi:hypothetical protein